MASFVGYGLANLGVSNKEPRAMQAVIARKEGNPTYQKSRRKREPHRIIEIQGDIDLSDSCLDCAKPQHQAHVLHRRARGSFAEIVELRDKHCLTQGFIRED